MKRKLFSALSIIALAGTVQATNQKDARNSPAAEAAAQAPAGHTLSEFKIGTLITGPDVKLADARGKAVVIEYWGIHCGPCLASLPLIEKLASEHKERLMVIGAHSQQAPDNGVVAVAQKMKLSYSIVKGVTAPVDVACAAIPHVHVFDTKGILVFNGHPDDPKFAEAVNRVMPPKKD